MLLAARPAPLPSLLVRIEPASETTAWGALEDGDLAMAGALLDESGKIGEASGSTYHVARHGLVAGWVARATGDFDAARRHLERARDAALRTGLRSLGVAIRAELAAVTGNVRDAEDVARELTGEFASEWRAEATAALWRVLPEGEGRTGLRRATRAWVGGGAGAGGGGHDGRSRGAEEGVGDWAAWGRAPVVTSGR